jgi:hypothetical protein
MYIVVVSMLVKVNLTVLQEIMLVKVITLAKAKVG